MAFIPVSPIFWRVACASVRTDRIGASRPLRMTNVNLFSALVDIDTNLAIPVGAAGILEAIARLAGTGVRCFCVRTESIWRAGMWRSRRDRGSNGAFIHVSAVRTASPVPGRGTSA